jgi:hypothetical protein
LGRALGAMRLLVFAGCQALEPGPATTEELHEALHLGLHGYPRVVRD